jgi:hypothetical protein
MGDCPIAAVRNSWGTDASAVFVLLLLQVAGGSAQAECCKRAGSAASDRMLV